MSQSILLIDDDALLRRSLSYTLQRAGYVARAAGTATEGLELVRQSPPDLVLLDIGLPGMDGLEALHTLRGNHRIPVILLTARRSDRDETLGLTLGADDYVKKPYDTDVLLARIAAVLRRNQLLPKRVMGGMLQEMLCVGSLEIDPHTRAVRSQGRLLDLTPRVFDLLYLLASRANVVVPMSEILHNLWGADFGGEPQVVYVHIRWLREHLESLPGCGVRIVTVHRVGYKLVVEGS